MAGDEASQAAAVGGQAPEGSSAASPTESRTPRPEPHPQLWLDEKDSLSFADPDQRKDRTGDIRFSCKKIGCALESDTSTITQLFGETGATLDECRIIMKGATAHSFSVTAAPDGSEFCVRHRNGDIALLVLQTKSTALWDTKGASFLMVDMTIWRDAAES